MYTGIASDLISRIQQHISKIHFSSFTAKYNIQKLVYYCLHPTIEEAITEEKRIKAGSGEKKIKLIESKSIVGRFMEERDFKMVMNLCLCNIVSITKLVTVIASAAKQSHNDK